MKEKEIKQLENKLKHHVIVPSIGSPGNVSFHPEWYINIMKP